MGLPKEQIKCVKEYNEKYVRDIMSSLENFSSVSADTSVKNAVYILKNSVMQETSGTINYLLVFENKSLIGYVGIPEFLASVQPPNLRDDWYRGWNVTNWADPAFISGLFTNLCLDVADKSVRDIMEPFGAVIGADSTLEEAVFKLFREKRDILPVMEGARLVGILRSADLFQEMANIML
ncbi:MAG: CBS domain-containing protein [Bacillota bacterium]